MEQKEMEAKIRAINLELHELNVNYVGNLEKLKQERITVLERINAQQMVLIAEYKRKKAELYIEKKDLLEQTAKENGIWKNIMQEFIVVYGKYPELIELVREKYKELKSREEEKEQ